MRVLIVSKILVVAAYRRKLDEIAARPEIERLVVVTPPAWQEPGGRKLCLEPSRGAPGYDLRVEPIWFNGSSVTGLIEATSNSGRVCANATAARRKQKMRRRIIRILYHFILHPKNCTP